jgi:hypothetical protein
MWVSIVGVQPGPFDGSDPVGHDEPSQSNGNTVADIHTPPRPLTIQRGGVDIGVARGRRGCSAIRLPD